jgi:hypothetical protein
VKQSCFGRGCLQEYLPKEELRAPEFKVAKDQINGWVATLTEIMS